MKKLIVIFLLFPAMLYAADTKTTALTELTAVVDGDILYIVDDPGVTPLSKKITVLNLFDTIDTSLKLLTILTNETGTGFSVFATAPTFTTSILAAGQADIGSTAAEFGDIFIGDGKIIKFGDDQDVTLTHVADTGLLLNLGIEIDGLLNADGIVTLGDGGDNFSIASDGIDIDTSGNITNAGTIASGVITVTGLLNTSVGIDAVGAVDLDYGSVDVTDHTFTSDGGTFIVDGTISSKGNDIGSATEEWNDLFLNNAGQIQWGEDQEIRLTHVPDVGLLLNGDSDNQLQFGDSGTYINQSTDGTLSLVADIIADITAPNIKMAFDAAAYLNIATADGGITTISQVSDGTDEIRLGDGSDLISVASGNWDVSNAGVFSGMTGITSTGAMDFGGATSTELVNAAAPTTNATGEIALDTTIVDHQPLWQYFDGGENMTVIAIDTAQLPAQDNEIVKYDAATDKFVLEADASAGSTAWDDIADPDNSGLTTITFDNAELSLLTGDNDAAASFFTIQNTDVDHTVGNLYLLDLDYSADDGDVDADFLKCQDSGGVVLTIQQNGDLTSTGTVQGATITDGTATLTSGAYTGLAGIVSTGAMDFGAATSVEIPNSTDPDVDAVGEISNDTDGANEAPGGNTDVSLRGYDGANQFLWTRKLKTLNFTLISPSDIAAKDFIPIWHNNTGMAFTIVEWKAWSDTDDVLLDIETATGTNYSARTTVDAVTIATDLTGVFFGEDTTITSATIAADSTLAIDFGATAPEYVQMAITGWFNADVD